MYKCPSCNFAVQVEWNVCRRCGTPLPLELRDSDAAMRVPRLPVRRMRTAGSPPAAPSAVPGYRPGADTLLPHSTALQTPRGPDTLLPREPVTRAAPPHRSKAGAGAALAAVAAVAVTLRRLAHRH